ncbi:bifunctional riboflavin kinase/FAD synthetase [Govanella unica]|uniref:Riboflavin biosynthesis protein n=1 Tax=Govanella unica TaxID=2975056 RepID=A0A9X3TXT5_9PROT|nr:bifunctional riboflavin kinase/FAD synthetase [Govania unica]MDA5193940.1 bifunctional riboflavin kinase/FAD synthetase [Govania unica]
MQIFRHYEDIPPQLRGGVVALGNFDGFHRGHQAVIRTAAAEAELLHAPLWVFTTEPHPRAFFRPGDPPFRLTPLRAKTHCLETFGVDNMLVLPFDPALSGMLAQDFVIEVLIGGLGIKHAVVGYDYRFGKGRGGGVDVLRQMGGMEHFGVTIVAPITEEDGSTAPVVYSSSVIRRALQDGQVRAATEALGHWWFIDGHVLEGDKRGRTIGFPTLNLSMDDYLLPAFGVYAVRVVLPTGNVVEGVANIGRRPTFDKADVTLEVHLFDFTGDLYGQVVSVEIVDFIRPEQKFAGLDELKAQIAKDSVRARELLADPALARGRYRLPRLG